MTKQSEINGYNVAEIEDFIDTVKSNPAMADRKPTIVAHWVGESRARVEFGDFVAHIGGSGELNAMQTLLAALAACDVDLVAMHASIMGLKIESLSVEASGDFNVQSYLGIMNKPGPGYNAITYTVRISIPGATQEQINELHRLCEQGSPVGDSLSKAIPLAFEWIAEA